MSDITYRVEGDYLIPNIIMDDEADESSEEMIGRYGMMREKFLREPPAWDIHGYAPDGKAYGASTGDRQAGGGRIGVSAQTDDGGAESCGSDSMGAEGQCAEGYGGGSSASGSCVSVKHLVEIRNVKPKKHIGDKKFGTPKCGCFELLSKFWINTENRLCIYS